MWYVIFIFISFLQSVIGFTLMSSSVMRFREPINKIVTAGLFVMFLGISLLCYTLYTKGINSVDRYAVLVILVIELSWYLICSADNFFVSMFSFLTFVNIYVSISYISDNLAIHKTGLSFVNERILIRMLIYIVILPLLFKFVKHRFRKLVEVLDHEWRFATIVPFMFLMMQIMVLYYPSPYWHWENKEWNKVIIITLYLLFLAVYYLLYIQANAIVDKYALEKRQLLMGQQEKLWEAELARQKSAAANTMRQRHDMHHHNAVIMGMLQYGELDKLGSYLKSFDEALDTHQANTYCANPIANSILNVYANKANIEGIKTIFRASIPEKVGIDNVDLTCVLGNSLENALEGCLRISENIQKEISVTVKYIDQRLRIQVENTCVTDLIFQDELPITQKSSGGTGTKSILYTAERYDGTAGFSVVNGKFITQIVLNSN